MEHQCIFSVFVQSLVNNPFVFGQQYISLAVHHVAQFSHETAHGEETAFIGRHRIAIYGESPEFSVAQPWQRNVLQVFDKFRIGITAEMNCPRFMGNNFNKAVPPLSNVMGSNILLPPSFSRSSMGVFRTSTESEQLPIPSTFNIAQDSTVL
jgi:hypothetical protein